MMSDRSESVAPVAKPHRLVAKVTSWGEVRLDLECPYTLADRKVRRCNLGNEPTEPNTVTGCAFRDFENGEHHHSCPAAKDRTAKCAGQDDDENACWPSEPDECDGFESYEVGHMHPVEGCWAQELISEIGWDEAVAWRKDDKPTTDLTLPLDVDVWSDDEGVQIAVWVPANHVPNGSSPGGER